jgi:hypothetical protein
MYEAWLTPAFEGKGIWDGAVHSVFGRVANIALAQGGGMRLFTLCAPDVSRLPDAARVPLDWLAHVRIGEAARLTSTGVAVGGRTLPLVRGSWCGRIARYGGRIRAEAAALLAPYAKRWLEQAPASIRVQAMCDLRAGDGCRWLGLGGGLTPAFDDACVGAMALRCALGDTRPFRLPPMERTTQISARYLRLAGEGYFGEPLCDAVDALFGNAPLAPALEELAAVGATSGCDMLAGIGAMLAVAG